MHVDNEHSVVGAAIAAAAASALQEANDGGLTNERHGRIWARQWLLQRERYTHMHLVRDLQENNPKDFHNYLRMSEESFNLLHQRVAPYITRKNTVMRAAVPSADRLSVTLRFLATGRSLTDLQYASAISLSLLSTLIPETCQAIIDSLRDFMPFPKKREWLDIAQDFNTMWQFPNCGGAIDGKHIRITQPHNSGSYFHNYKGFFSIILLALANANYEFIMVDVGLNGRISDGGALEHTQFGKRLSQFKLGLPDNTATYGNMNFVFLADEAFPLRKNLLRPYPQISLTPQRRVFNYRLSRARRVVESAFGILATRFRIFHTAINLKINSIDRVVLACCILHNFLRKREGLNYIPPGYADTINPSTGECVAGEWRAHDPHLLSLNTHISSGRMHNDVIANRENYCNFLNGPGAVAWQPST
ncbi:LOW QUALITY PROTEIN: putative nuclease HARBI1 [Anomaloglossus baeobatrachus]